jgi:putative glutamine amidotransferase
MPKKPIIGITLSFFRTASREEGRQSPWLAYADVVSENGGLPLFLPTHLDPGQSRGIYERIDGLILSGGGDILPQSYGDDRRADLDEPDPQRDAFEFDALEQAMQREIPFLGICRGLQVLNVGLGGSLLQDIPSDCPECMPHKESDACPEPHHPVLIQTGTRIHSIIRETQIETNSYHHQAIRDLAPALTRGARSPDEIIEAVELPDFPFGLAVQWHPERMRSAPSTKALLGALMRAAARA